MARSRAESRSRFARVALFRRVALLALLSLATLVAIACASPTLPLPPPAIPSVASAGEGKVTLRSVHGAEPNAIILLINHNESLPRDQRVDGTEADPDGTWEATVYASPGDVMDVIQEYGTMRSPQTTFRIPN